MLVLAMLTKHTSWPCRDLKLPESYAVAFTGSRELCLCILLNRSCKLLQLSLVSTPLFYCKLAWFCFFKMCLRTAFALLFLLGLTEYACTAPVVDDKNAIANLAMENYYAILNESGA